ncbi:MAG: DUF1592 domain-containing protein [Myxococcota bacterium]
MRTLLILSMMSMGLSMGCTLGLQSNGDKGGDPSDTVEGACEDDLDRFENYVWDTVLAQDCILCHAEGGAASGSSMVFRREDQDGWRKHNLEQTRAAALKQTEGASTLLMKPTNQHIQGHGGGEVLSEGDPKYAALEAFVERVSGTAEDCDPKDETFADCVDDVAGVRRLRRLTHEEYAATVEDLVGVSVPEAEDFATDDVVHGFSNNAEVLDVSNLLADQYRLAAESVAAQVDLDDVVECNARDIGYGNCAYQFIRDFGLKAYRRPLEMREIDTYHRLWEMVAEDDGFDEGVRWVITAMLQAPGFLYRSELGTGSGGTFTLNDYEIAAELSYLIWGSMPDRELFDLAAAGALQDPAVRAEQVERMLEATRTAGRYNQFIDEWLGLDALMFVTRDDALTRGIREDMIGETERLAEQTLRNGGDFTDLLLSETTYMTDALAAFYGLPPGSGPADQQGFRAVSLADGPYRGLLTQGSITATYANPEETSPIHRGLMVRARLLCNELPEPPANIDTSPPDVDPDLTTRERFAQHTEDPACRDCHEKIDGIGFSFEHFDSIGRWREMDGVHPVDDSGEIIGSESTDAVFEGVEELAEILADSDEVRDCYNEMWLTHTLGTDEKQEVQCLTGWMQTASEPTLQGRIKALVTATTFTTREGEADELSAPLGDADQALPGVDEDEDISFEDPNWEIERDTVSSWNSGYCRDIYVRNISDVAVSWFVDEQIEGTISSHWTAEVNGDRGMVRFTGMSWNATLEPGDETKFGYCANR